MAKNYLTDLQEWVQQKKGLNGSSANSARVIFLAIRDDVKAAIEAGYSLTTIWEHMHDTGRVTTTYETFRRHVRRYIKQPPIAGLQSNLPATSSEGEKKNRTTLPPSVDAGEKEARKTSERRNRDSSETKAQTGLPSFKFEPPKKTR